MENGSGDRETVGSGTSIKVLEGPGIG